jgi:hypothetical protein
VEEFLMQLLVHIGMKGSLFSSKSSQPAPLINPLQWGRGRWGWKNSMLWVSCERYQSLHFDKTFECIKNLR